MTEYYSLEKGKEQMTGVRLRIESRGNGTDRGWEEVKGQGVEG